MLARAVSPFRMLLIHLTANLNLILGGLALAFGVYILVAGADAMATVMQAGDAGADALGKVAPGDDAKKAGDILALASKGVGAIFVAMASIVAGCAIVQGLPLVLVGLGILFRQGWARVFGILFGLLGLLQGLACLGGSGGTRGVLISGAVFTAYGLLSLIALIGGGAAIYFSRQAPAEGEPEPVANNGRWALAGVVASVAIVALSTGLALNTLLTTGGRPGPVAANRSRRSCTVSGKPPGRNRTALRLQRTARSTTPRTKAARRGATSWQRRTPSTSNMSCPSPFSWRRRRRSISPRKRLTTRTTRSRG